MQLDCTRMNRFVPYSYEDNIVRTYYGTVKISYESALRIRKKIQVSYVSICIKTFKFMMSNFVICWIPDTKDSRISGTTLDPTPPATIICTPLAPG